MRYYYTLLHNRMCVVEFDIHILDFSRFDLTD